MKQFRASLDLKLVVQDITRATRLFYEAQKCCEDLGFELEATAIGEPGRKPESSATAARLMGSAS